MPRLQGDYRPGKDEITMHFKMQMTAVHDVTTYRDVHWQKCSFSAIPCSFQHSWLAPSLKPSLKIEIMTLDWQSKPMPKKTADWLASETGAQTWPLLTLLTSLIAVWTPTQSSDQNQRKQPHDDTQGWSPCKYKKHCWNLKTGTHV